MAKHYVMTLMAANRVGILAAVSQAIAELKGDIQEVSVTVMGGFFTIILAVDFPENREANVIVAHIHGIGRHYGLEVCLKDCETAVAVENSAQKRITCYLHVSGKNQPGMMRQVSLRLAQHEIDIADLYAVRNTDGTFVMDLELSVPVGFAFDDLPLAINGVENSSDISAQIQSRADYLNARSSRSACEAPRELNRDLV